MHRKGVFSEEINATGVPLSFSLTFPLWFWCCNSVKIAGRKACTCHKQHRLPRYRVVGCSVQESCSFYNLFRPPQRDGIVMLPQRILRHGAVKDFNRLLNEFTHSELCFSFKPRDWKSSVPHSYVTEDLSKCSFRLSAGGGPRHLAGVDGGGGISWSTQIMKTMEQMTADKLQRVGWPEKRGGAGGINLLTCQTPSLLLLLEGECLEKAHGLSWA